MSKLSIVPARKARATQAIPLHRVHVGNMYRTTHTIGEGNRSVYMACLREPNTTRPYVMVNLTTGIVCPESSATWETLDATLEVGE